MQVKSSKYNTLLEISDTPFAKGGEAELYQVINSKYYPSHLAKIYFPHKRNPQQEYKIQYLLRHAPSTVTDQDIPWIKDLLYSPEGDFIGFILPKVQGQKLEVLCLPKLPRYLADANHWQPFSRDSTTAISYRLQVCLNLAGLVAKIHEMGCYTIIDLKPDNILLRPDGTVSIIDIDSMEITEDNIELFAAKVITHEYTPPEYYRGINPQSHIVENSWDRFSLAVIIYRVLLGIHPFAATALPPFGHLNTIAQKIEQGLFVHAPAKPVGFKHIPRPQQYFLQLPQLLQDLFIDCFEDGYTEPDLRPTASQWEQALYLALRQIQHLTIQDSAYEDHYSVNTTAVEKNNNKKEVTTKSKSAFISKIQNYIPSRAFTFLAMLNCLVFGYLTFDLFWFNNIFSGLSNSYAYHPETNNLIVILFILPLSIQLVISFLAAVLGTNEYDREIAKLLFLSLLFFMAFSLIFPIIDYIFGDNLSFPEMISTIVIVTGIMYYPYMSWWLFNIVIRNDAQLEVYDKKLQKREEQKEKEREARWKQRFGD